MKHIYNYLTLTFLVTLLTTLKAFSQTATITTDQADYPPGSTVIITGEGWFPGETVRLQVPHFLGLGDNTRPVHQPFTTVADSNGIVQSSWYIPEDEDELGATLLLTADGLTSGFHAEMIFTDETMKIKLVQLPSRSQKPQQTFPLFLTTTCMMPIPILLPAPLPVWAVLTSAVN